VRVTSAIRPGMPRRDSLRFVGGALARAHPTWRGFCNDLCNGSRSKCDRATRKPIFIIIHTAHTYMHTHTRPHQEAAAAQPSLTYLVA